MKRALLLLVLLLGCKKPAEQNDAPAAATADSARVAIPTDGRLPVITHWKPKGDARHRAILLVHGGGGPELVFGKWLRPYTDALTEAGYEVYMPHYFQRKQAAEIETMHMTVTFMQEQKTVLPDRIGALGFSRGGFISVETAARDDRLKAVVECYGGIHRDPAKEMTRMPPTLIMHGDKDPIVTVDHAYDLKKLFEEKKVVYEMKIYAGEEHGFGGDALTDSVKRTIAFFDKHLAGAD